MMRYKLVVLLVGLLAVLFAACEAAIPMTTNESSEVAELTELKV